LIKYKVEKKSNIVDLNLLLAESIKKLYQELSISRATFNCGYEVVRACSTHGRGEKLNTKFRSENLKGRDHSEDLGVGGRKIL